MYQETHPNPNEIFPVKGDLGGPGETAKAKAIAGLVGSMALAAAVVVMLMLSVFCSALNITATSADIRVRLENWDEAPVTWLLAPYSGEAGGPDQPLRSGELTQAVGVLELQGLTPDTWYELRFYSQADLDTQEPAARYCFRTAPGEPEPTETEPGPTETEPEPTETEPKPTETEPEPTETEPEPTETEPPATQPVAPPVIYPPQTDPPEILPPQTDPPQTDPPKTDPPETEPPATDPPIPEPIPPEANTPMLQGFTAPGGEGLGGYTASFSFLLNDGIPNEIRITDTVSTYSNFSPDSGNQGSTEITQTTVTRSFAPGEIAVDTAANTATVTYLAENAYAGHAMVAELDYTLPDAQGGSPGTGTVTSPVHTAAPTYLYGMEVTSANTWTTSVNGESLEVVLMVGDLQMGSFAYALNEMNIYVDYNCQDGTSASYALAELIAPPPLPGQLEDILTYSFAVPLDPGGWESPLESVFLSMDATGDCLWNGQAMGLMSETFGYTQVSFAADPGGGTAYRVEGPALAFTPEFTAMLQDVLGLQVDSLMLVDPVTGAQGTSLDAVEPDSAVYVYLYFSGTALSDASLTPNVTLAEDIAAPGLEACPITAGAEGCFFTFEFIMPQRDVLSGDIVINDLGLEIVGPPAGG